MQGHRDHEGYMLRAVYAGPFDELDGIPRAGDALCEFPELRYMYCELCELPIFRKRPEECFMLCCQAIENGAKGTAEFSAAQWYNQLRMHTQDHMF